MVGSETERGVRLTDRDLEILGKHFLCFHISTYEALHRLYWRDTQMDAVKKWTQRMQEGGYIAEADLYARTVSYFHLTTKAVRALNLPERLAKPPDGFALAYTYGILSFCCLGDVIYQKFSSPEFERTFPELCVNRLESRFYYRDHDFGEEGAEPVRRFGYLFVDAQKRVRDILRRFQTVASQRLRVKAWYALIHGGLFVYTIVTSSEGKKRRLMADIAPHRRKIPIPVRIEVRSDLVHVIPPGERHAPQPSEDA